MRKESAIQRSMTNSSHSSSSPSVRLYSQEDLIQRLELARLLTLASGQTALSRKNWDKSGELEAERQRRMEEEEERLRRLRTINENTDSGAKLDR